MVEFMVHDLKNFYVHDGSLHYLKYDEDLKILDVRMQLPEVDSPVDQIEVIVRFAEIEIAYASFAFNELDWEEYEDSSVLGMDYLPEMQSQGKEGCACWVWFSNRRDVHRNGVVIFLTSGYDVVFIAKSPYA